MRNWCWIIFMMVLASSCLEEAECVKSGDTALVIKFKKLSNGTADTLFVDQVVAAGADSVFYSSQPLNGTAVLSVNPYAEETEFTFVLESGQKTLKVGYRNEVRLISEECGSDRVQVDLTILETQFDSVRVVNSALTKNRATNIEIFH
jgi:hypothetical protein